MKFRMAVLVAGFAAGLPLAAAAAPASQAYVESSSFLTGGAPGAIDLGEVPDAGGPVVGPDGVGSGFDAVGERVNIRGALNVAKDDFSVTGDLPLRVVLNDVLFRDGGGTLRVTVNSTDAAEDGLTFDVTAASTVGAIGNFAELTSVTFDNVAGGELIEYDVDLVATPLPGAAALFGAAVAGLGIYRRRAAARA